MTAVAVEILEEPDGVTMFWQRNNVIRYCGT
jgi:hypothetical protein